MLKVKNKYLYIIIVGLLFLYIFSFIFQRSDKRTYVKSSLINPSNVNKIDSFELFDGDKEKLIFQKNGNVWEIIKIFDDNLQKLPAETKKLKIFSKLQAKLLTCIKYQTLLQKITLL